MSDDIIERLRMRRDYYKAERRPIIEATEELFTEAADTEGRTE